MKIHSVLIDIDAVSDAMLAKQTRQRVYPAHEAAVKALTELVNSRLEAGKKVHTLSERQIMSLGFGSKTARSAILKLKDAGIIKKVIGKKFNAGTGTSLPSRYTINEEFVVLEEPKTVPALWLAFHNAGGEFEEWHAVKSAWQLQNPGKKATASDLRPMLEAINDKTSKRKATAVRYGREAI